ncbi:MAG: 2,3,4,5-tetrahydropyridine-2,6-dicarboxylate N-succinyltransferase [Alphaproteobacteria bacterium]|nr:2,3,4,5-tetrahydropyridine-2,6-dicarboxylate N-succinyltransferase [Alphaproteobacteria bacterium]
MKYRINEAFDQRDNLKNLENFSADVQQCLNLLNKGELRVAEKIHGTWTTHEWIKKAILLSFRLNPNIMIDGFDGYHWFDKVPLKHSDTSYRSVPGAIVRHSAFVEPDAILMPSFINVGARVGEGTMIDTWVTVGSCAQIGKHCHISGGVGIGGVLEPLQANPVIIEDNCFIGARSEIAEGVIVEEGAVISMGVFIGASTKIVNRVSGKIIYGRVPAYSVVVPGTLPDPKNPLAPSLACAVIVKQVDEKTRSKTSINDLLRD